jgi:hypothetical protein
MVHILLQGAAGHAPRARLCPLQRDLRVAVRAEREGGSPPLIDEIVDEGARRMLAEALQPPWDRPTSCLSSRAGRPCTPTQLTQPIGCHTIATSKLLHGGCSHRR